jgi:hypothetical protein
MKNFIAIAVGWVERSDTQQLHEINDGYRVAQPILPYSMR